MIVVYSDRGEIQIMQDGQSGDVAEAYRRTGKHVLIMQNSVRGIGEHYVDSSGGEPTVKERPRSSAKLSKKLVAANGKDAAKIIGVSKGARIIVSDGLSVSEHVADGKPIEISADAPCKYRIEIDAFPQLPFSCEIEAR